MRRSYCGVAVLALCAMVVILPHGVGLAGDAGEPDLPAWLRESGQMVLVVAPDWDSSYGELRRYERSSGRNWVQVGGTVDVVLGRHGLGWGLGLYSDELPLEGEPIKMEGDGKAPVGAFLLPEAFAYDPHEVATDMPLVAVDANLFCVDDTSDQRYNELVRLPEGGSPPWASAETMLRPDGLYRFGVFVAHNQSPPIPGRGSCIFMHIAASDNSPTSGCTAMAREAIHALVLWLRPAARPVFIQLPRSVFDRLQGPWRLPLPE